MSIQIIESERLTGGNKRKRDSELTYREPASKKRYVVQDLSIYTSGKEIRFTAGVNKMTIEKMIKEISNVIDKFKDKYSDWTENDPKLSITYVVDSPGGSVTDVLKFVDFINLTRKKCPFVEFVSVITGLAASAATTMCIVADKKYMTENSQAMIHELSSGNMGKYTHMMSYSEFLTKLHDKLVKIYLDNGCKMEKDVLETILKNETWFNAEEYLQYGFVDAIK